MTRGTHRLCIAIVLASIVAMGGPAAAKPYSPVEWANIEAMQESSTTLLLQEKHQEALKLARRSLTAAEKLFGPDHPVVAMSLNIIGDIYNAQSRHGEADLMLRRALIIRQVAQSEARDQGVTGPSPLPRTSVAQSLNNLATLYGSEGRFREAEAMLSMTLEVYERAYGPQHAHVLTTLESTALLFLVQQKYAEAERLMQKYPTIRAAMTGDAETITVGTSTNVTATNVPTSAHLATPVSRPAARTR
jgi:tetratricopeptide (TPR) repeat protein